MNDVACFFGLYIMLWRERIGNVGDVARFFFAIVLPMEDSQDRMPSSAAQQVKCEVPCHPVGKMSHFIRIFSQVFMPFPQPQQHFSNHILSIFLIIK